MADGQTHHHEGHDLGQSQGHGHSHGIIDSGIASTERGLWALKWSFLVLLATALLQLVVVVISGSVALLADTIHNFADAGTAIPLWIAFAVARLPPSRRFSYGYGRAEDLAGVVIVLTILFSALLAGYQTILRFLHPQPVTHLWTVAGASLIGFLGNEGVALFRIRVGRQIGSAALVADGYHARADGWTSLAVLVGAAGVWFGYPLADPAIGLLITLAILYLVWESAREIFVRMLDGVAPELLEAVEHAARHTSGVRDVGEVRARWIGHRLTFDLNVAVNPDLSVTDGHGIAKEIRHQILHHVPHVASVTIHVDPASETGEGFHRIAGHAHDGLPVHRHD